MKYNYYVGVIVNSNMNRIKYVTDVNNANKVAHWKDGQDAKSFSLSSAKDLQYGLVANGYQALVITAPKYMELKNPTIEQLIDEAEKV